MTADRAAFPPPFDADAGLAGRAMLVRSAEVDPDGVRRARIPRRHGWSQYRATAPCAGSRCPTGSGASKLPESIFTPTTKAAEGHDLPLAPAEARFMVGDGLYERLREVSIAVYERIAERSAAAGLIVADTKFEFGFDHETRTSR